MLCDSISVLGFAVACGSVSFCLWMFAHHTPYVSQDDGDTSIDFVALFGYLSVFVGENTKTTVSVSE
jgi:hypothetical protein